MQSWAREVSTRELSISSLPGLKWASAEGPTWFVWKISVTWASIFWPRLGNAHKIPLLHFQILFAFNDWLHLRSELCRCLHSSKWHRFFNVCTVFIITWKYSTLLRFLFEGIHSEAYEYFVFSFKDSFISTPTTWIYFGTCGWEDSLIWIDGYSTVFVSVEMFVEVQIC